MDTEPMPVSVVPPSEPPARKRGIPQVLWWVLGIIVVLAGIGGAGAYVYMHDSFGWRAHADAVSILPHLRVLEGTLDTRTVGDYTAQGAYRAHSLAVKGDLVDYVTLDGKTEYALVAAPETKPSTAIVRIADGHTETLVGATSTKLWLALSPDGSTLAYAEREPFTSTSTKPDPTTAYDPNAWTVHVLDLRTGSSTAIAHAATPRFFTRDGVTYLLYLQVPDIHIRSLTDGTEFTLAHVNDGLWPVEVARDGHYLAVYNRSIQSYEFFTFELAHNAITTTQLPQPQSAMRIITFDKTSVGGVAYDMKTKQSSFVVADLADRSKETVLFSDPKLEHARRIILIP
jgi:hypothetical protein